MSAQPQPGITERRIAVLHDTDGNRIGEIEITGNPPYQLHVIPDRIGRPDGDLVIFRIVGDDGGSLGGKIAYVETGEQSRRPCGSPPKNVTVDQKPAVPME